MEWLAQNGLSVFLTVLFMVLVLRGPILGRVYGVEHLSVHGLAERMKGNQQVLLLDVRTPGEYAEGHIQGTWNFPLSDLSGQLEAVRAKAAPEREVVVICRSGARSLNGAVTLKRAGFAKVYNLSGGMLQWKAQGYPVRS
ncbi:MAG: rhodanese-like domain-containing protein [Magnetococcales bacterium]|nr:rhodanese-like domain-containing protein [Magnetococcales bacterium]